MLELEACFPRIKTLATRSLKKILTRSLYDRARKALVKRFDEQVDGLSNILLDYYQNSSSSSSRENEFLS